MATSKQLQYTADPVMAREVRDGLTATPKRLPSKLFYDEVGSALFEAITELPEYYLTRTERAIFEDYTAEILEAAGPALTLVELGAGTASKTCILIEELLQRQSRALFYPIDVSSAALNHAVRQMTAQFPALRVNPVVADYMGGVPALSRITGRKLVLYIGSSIGNFEHSEAIGMLRRIRRSLRSGDALLLGTDLAKSPKILVPAYDDAQGVTAQFNKNILARLNRELEADFDLGAFKHVAVWNKHCSRMEIYLESLAKQSAFIPAIDLDVCFEQGERLHTENSYKWTLQAFDSLVRNAGWQTLRVWVEPPEQYSIHLIETHL